MILIAVAWLVTPFVAHRSAVRFLITADPQFGMVDKENPDPDHTIKWNTASRQTLRAMANAKLKAPDIRGIIVAGDLTHNSLPYAQYDLYKTALNSLVDARGR